MALRQHFNYRKAKPVKKAQHDDPDRQAKFDASLQAVGKVIHIQSSKTITGIWAKAADDQRRKTEKSRTETPQRQYCRRMGESERHRNFPFPRTSPQNINENGGSGGARTC